MLVGAARGVMRTAVSISARSASVAMSRISAMRIRLMRVGASLVLRSRRASVGRDMCELLRVSEGDLTVLTSGIG